LLIVVALGVAGIIVLSVATDHLVLGSARLAARMRVAPVVVGIVIIGFGTSAPELLVSGTAARAGHTGLAIGNLTGSNVLNLTLVLGLAGMAAPLTVRSSVVRREAPVAVGGVGMFAMLAARPRPGGGSNPVCLTGSRGDPADPNIVGDRRRSTAR
jgi:cation:H+ antiporter